MTHSASQRSQFTMLEADIERAGITDEALLRAAVSEAYSRISLLLGACFEDFSPAQQRMIRAAVGAGPASAPSPPRKVAKRTDKAPKVSAPPRFWLPYSGETWSGRGRPPQAFLAWEGTVAHTEWKKHHPDERFPAYPG